MTDKHPVQLIADAVGGTIESAGSLPDGSGFAVLSMPLPKNHWSVVNPDEFGVPPMGLRMGTNDPRREEVAHAVREAVRYGYRAATMNGKEPDLDPDALVQNVIVGLLGYWTPDGLSKDEWANPRLAPTLWAPEITDEDVGAAIQLLADSDCSGTWVSATKMRNALRAVLEQDRNRLKPTGYGAKDE